MKSYIIAVVLISLLLATLGSGKQVGFWKVFILSILTSPVVGIFVVLFSSEKKLVTENS